MDPKPFLVTGASRGIGRAVCRALIERGEHIVAVARDKAALSKLAKDAPGQVVVVPADLADADARCELPDVVQREFGGLSGVVHAAGVALHQPLAALKEGALRTTFELNFFIPVLLTRKLAPMIIDGGSVTFISSTLASRPAANTLAYSASKAALEAALKTMALELAPRLRVNAVAPGLVDTAMTRVLRLEPGQTAPTGPALERQLREQQARFAAMAPLGRMGRAEEIAEATCALIASEWSTGTVLVLDGGLSCA